MLSSSLTTPLLGQLLLVVFDHVVDPRSCRGRGHGLVSVLGIVAGQCRVDTKTNEITALPVLLESLPDKIVTADALHTQRSTAATLTGANSITQALRHALVIRYDHSS